MSRQFRLIAQKMNPGKLEKDVVALTMNYLHKLRDVGVQCWINEEHPGPRGRSHHLRRRASDIIGICKGRWLCFEMKREKDYAYIMGHWDQLKANRGKQNSTYEHYRDQIEFVELIQNHGGLAFFACSWEMVRDRLIKEGIDPGTMIYAGGPKP